MNKFLLTLITALALPIAVNAEDQTFEIWEESHFKFIHSNVLKMGQLQNIQDVSWKIYLKVIGI